MKTNRKWDQMTMSALYTMAIVRRRDITSMRDLKKKDVPWLRKLSTRMIQALATKYPEIEGDQIKLYVHCKFPMPKNKINTRT